MNPVLLLIGGAVVLMLGSGKKKRAAAANGGESPKALLRQLAMQTGNADMDPANRPMDVIITEIQMTSGIEPADGKWNPQTEAAIRQFLSEN